MLESIKKSSKSIPVILVVLFLILSMFLLEVYFGGRRSKAGVEWQNKQNCSIDCAKSVSDEK